MKGKNEGRTVPLHPEAREALAGWLLEFDPFRRRCAETFVFQSREGSNRAISRPRVKQILDAVCEPTGITGPLGTHAMRKTFARRIYEKSGGDLFRTQQALGHRSVNSTVSYLGSTREDIDELILSA
jgi:site-specific recombinase XerD